MSSNGHLMPSLLGHKQQPPAQPPYPTDYYRKSFESAPNVPVAPTASSPHMSHSQRSLYYHQQQMGPFSPAQPHPQFQSAMPNALSTQTLPHPQLMHQYEPASPVSARRPSHDHFAGSQGYGLPPGLQHTHSSPHEGYRSQPGTPLAPQMQPGTPLGSVQMSSSPVTPQSASYNPWASPHSTPAGNYARSRVSPVRKGQQQTPQQHYNPSMPTAKPYYWNQPQQTPQTQPPPTVAPQSAPPVHAPPLHSSQPQPQQEPPASIPPPAFRPVERAADLNPQVNPRPQNRRALPEGGYMSPLMCLTLQLSATYQICNSGFNYESSKNPRRVLTKPSEPKLNNGHDNRDNDYILYVNDVLGTDENKRYLVLDILGQGTFGQVVKCQNMKTKDIVAVKVIKNNPAFLNQSMMEVSILEYLNNSVDNKDEHHILRLKDKFLHKQHYCLVFELLSSNLYELLKQNQFRGLSINLVRVFSRQLLDSLTVLKNAKLIHCDLKPENILLKNLDSPIIKVIDFGSACHERKTVYTYIQSRFYRSPEVLLGIPYTTSIDMWSMGCIIAELFLGLPIFPGASEYNQLSRIVASLGDPPNWMVEMGKNSGKFMEKIVDDQGRKRYRLKSRERYSREFNVDEKESKQYFTSANLKTIIMEYPLHKKDMKRADIDKEMLNREALYDFLMGLLNYNPFERWTPQQAASHPFITESKFTGPFVPHPKEEKDVFHPTPTAQPISQSQPLHAQGQNSNVMVPPVAGSSQSSEAAQYAHMQPPANWSTGLKQQNSGSSSRRPRALTYGSMDPIPPPIQRATAMVNPADHIQAQPSPAYIPPPELGRNHQGQSNEYGEVVRKLENGLMSRW
ncbi:Dual specificity protein kinase YAK1 [Yarrowia sp. B02]|nr:Dual specificity protein kinase YAK1 [Yarrowia sp. B02]